ncbi:type II 3-dehydroquinate dehydratase [Campylobacter sp. RM16187]|uniref:type II 3-dehydroquinate dehydratase n=1 Tax=Campylobacter sp. RM16187 TaxID=1660063 RepID=UPI0021B504B1|nr:type II 3-dehydroquinate dehydratase [Campylobacter sp. RM16187]QKG28664.1 3-dehydroquinate dehydratase [Campylobacter sp. RM16187]
MDKKFKVMVIQGPNINMLGTRETSIYGVMKMEDIHNQMKIFAEQNDVDIEFFQSNLEGELVDKIQECYGDADGIIINPAAYTHSSIAIRDALSAVSLPAIEVHISNIHRREEFRQKSMISAVTAGQIVGFGPVGYHLAMIAMLQIFEQIKAVRQAQNTQE